MPLSTGSPLIELRSASFGYADRTVVSGVDLTVHPGEVVALLGANGSGKSTLVRGLLGLTEQHGGDVLLLGTPRDRFHEHTRIGYVPQRHSLSASVRATVREIVAVGPGRFEDGKRIPLDVQVGNRVLYGKYSGTEVTVEGDSLLILRETDILAIINS